MEQKLSLSRSRGLLHAREQISASPSSTIFYSVIDFKCAAVQVLVLGFDGVRLIKATAQGKNNGTHWTVILLPASQSLAWFVLSFSALYCKYKPSEKFHLLSRIWWVASFVICLSILYADGRGFMTQGSSHLNSHVIANFAITLAVAFLCFIAIRGDTGIQVYRNSDLQEPLLEEEAGSLKITPYSQAGLFSLATLSWLNPLLSIGAKRSLELKDIPLLAPKDRSKTNYKSLNSNWEKLKAQNTLERPSLAWAIFKTFWKEAARNAVFAGENTLVSYVGPYMISYFVDYLGGKETFPHECYILAAIFFLAKLVETLTTRQWYLGVDILGMHVRSALTAMVYRKGLRLSSSARQSHTSGVIVNYMAVDVQRLAMDKKSWLWNKKSSDKQAAEKANDSDIGANQVDKGKQDNNNEKLQFVKISYELYKHLNGLGDQVKSYEEQMHTLEDEVKDLNGNLAEANSEMTDKDNLVKKHAKVAEEAVSVFGVKTNHSF